MVAWQFAPSQYGRYNKIRSMGFQNKDNSDSYVYHWLSIFVYCLLFIESILSGFWVSLFVASFNKEFYFLYWISWLFPTKNNATMYKYNRENPPPVWNMELLLVRV